MSNVATSNVVSDFLGRLGLGDPVADQGLTIVPVFGVFAGLPEFVTLEQAIASGSLLITEVSESGSVPSLKAHNAGSTGVLILDGEELAGAKQNRVLNTSVYIKPGQEVIIPVSCTEAGRWVYRTRTFSDSGHISAQALRFAANESVTQSVRSQHGFHSDQSRIWEEVGLLQERHDLHSPTAAAREVYERRGDTVRRREALFPCLPKQIGILALWLGRVAGIDVVTSADAYSRLHTRLVRSYVLDAPRGNSGAAADDPRIARDWLAGLGGARVTAHASPGNGLSYRFTGEGVVGSALAVDGAVLHAVAFATQANVDGDDQHYPGFFERRESFPW